MASSFIGQHQVTTFTTPVNGTTPIDANVVRGNDNTLKTAYDAHDNDGTIHLQDSTNASRPVAGTVGRKWLDNDTYRVYYDDGAAWNEIAYLPSAGGTVSGAVTITSTATPQLTVKYDNSKKVTLAVSSDGAVTLDATGASAGFTFSDPVTVSGTVTLTGLVFTTSLASLTALATPTALAATQYTAFASTVSGATIMGFGTTGDVTLKNRSGTDVIVVTSNTSNVTLAGALAMSGAFSGATTITAAGAITATVNVNAERSISIVNTNAVNNDTRSSVVATADTVTAKLMAIQGNYAMVGSTSNHPVHVWVNANEAVVFGTNYAATFTAGLSLSNATAPTHGIQFGTSAPGSLANGQIWYDGTDFKVRTGGATKTITVT